MAADHFNADSLSSSPAGNAPNDKRPLPRGIPPKLDNPFGFAVDLSQEPLVWADSILE
jgi:hypothetical protein